MLCCCWFQQIFPEDVKALFQHCLMTSYFQWDNEFYEQTDGVAMGSPLSPVIANFQMEHFKKQALASAPFTPTVWFRYVDDTFTIWNHGEEKLEEFQNHLNSIHPIYNSPWKKKQRANSLSQMSWSYTKLTSYWDTRSIENSLTQTGSQTKTPTTTHNKKEALSKHWQTMQIGTVKLNFSAPNSTI